MTEILALAFREREERKEKTAIELFASRDLSEEKTSSGNPKQTDPSLKISDEQFQQIFDLMVQEAGKPLENCMPLERAEALFEVIRVGGSYGISYEFSEEKTRKPYTAQEVLENKKGDCDELSRLFIAVENKLAEYGKENNVDLSLGDTKLLLIEFHTGEEEVSHTNVLLFQNEFHFFDPTFEQYNGLKLPKKYLSSEEMINDKEFVSLVEKVWNEAKGEERGYEVVEPLYVLEGEQAHATYYAELGYYYLNFYNFKGEREKNGKKLKRIIL